MIYARRVNIYGLYAYICAHFACIVCANSVYSHLEVVEMDIQKLRKVIEGRGIKQTWLADQIGVHPSTLNRFLTGRTHMSRAAIKSLLRELNLSEDSLKLRAS
jgi:ribosome-binding protein aMBF1 (putative translation factor)